MVAGVVNAAVEWFTGKDIGDQIFTALWDDHRSESVAVAAKVPEAAIAAPPETAPILPAAQLAPSALSLAPIDKPVIKPVQGDEIISLDSLIDPLAPTSFLPNAVFLKRLHDFTVRLDGPAQPPQPSRAAIRLIA